MLTTDWEETDWSTCLCKRTGCLSDKSHSSVEEHASCNDSHATKVETKHWSSVGYLLDRSGGGWGARSVRAGRVGWSWLGRSPGGRACGWQRRVHGADRRADWRSKDSRWWDTRNDGRRSLSRLRYGDSWGSLSSDSWRSRTSDSWRSRTRRLHWWQVARRRREIRWWHDWRSSLATIHGDGLGDGHTLLVCRTCQ
jgi:hypothetical protein